VGTQSNRSAIGARVRFVTGDVAQLREVSGGGSYLSQNDLRAHVGLGAATSVDRVEVRWPNGREEQWQNIKTDQIVVLVEGNSPNVGTGLE
jgi:enediyne biosynthesis protein E4